MGGPEWRVLDSKMPLCEGQFGRLGQAKYGCESSVWVGGEGEGLAGGVVGVGLAGRVVVEVEGVDASRARRALNFAFFFNFQSSLACSVIIMCEGLVLGLVLGVRVVGMGGWVSKLGVGVLDEDGVRSLEALVASVVVWGGRLDC